MVQAIDDAQRAATKLTSEAYNKGSADNITCVVVRFHHGGKRGQPCTWLYGYRFVLNDARVGKELFFTRVVGL